jgi:prepilin-type N-terminal cleavage/methylation domain-containing protein
MVTMASNSMTPRQRGFTVLELTLVVALLLMLGAIAVPNFMKSKSAANEAAAVSNIRVIHSVQVAYSTLYPAMGFADALSKLGPPLPGTFPSPIRADLLDAQLGCDAQPCRKNGYDFAIDQVEHHPVTNFRITAVPSEPASSSGGGAPGFCGSAVGLISADAGGGSNCGAPISRLVPES